MCDRPLEIIVAVTVTKPGCTNGLPMRETSLVPANNTLSNVILSPIFGGQYPSTTSRSPSVTLHCFPSKCIIAKLREDLDSIILLHVAITSLVVSATVEFCVGVFCVINLERMPPIKKKMYNSVTFSYNKFIKYPYRYTLVITKYIS